MKDNHDIAQGWLRKADSDLSEFWPDLAEVQDAVAAAKAIRQFIRDRLPTVA